MGAIIEAVPRTEGPDQAALIPISVRLHLYEVRAVHEAEDVTERVDD